MFGLLILGAIILYVVFAIWIVKRQKTKRAKWIAIAILVLIPTWDQILGRTYFYTLCTTESGVEVHKTVELPMEYFDKQGRPDFKFVKKDGVRLELAGRYVDHGETHSVSKLFRLERDIRFVKDFTTGELLGTQTSFRYFGGWLLFGAHRTADSCRVSSEEFYRAIFRQTASSK